MNTRKIGGQGEEMAQLFLEGLGYELVEKNFYCRWGEIDLIMKEGDELVFCEVKFRKDGRFGMPQESVGARKMVRFRKTVGAFLGERRWMGSWRIDVVGILGRVDGEIFHIKHAF